MKLFILLFCFFVSHSEAFGNLGNLAVLNPLNMMFQNRCMTDLGCFYTGPPFFNPTIRPISLPPVNNPKPKFMLYTQTNTDNPFMLEATPRSLQSSPFNPSAECKFFIHGFKFKLNPNDATFQAKEDLLQQGAYNVFIVDWTDYNGQPYDQAVANTRVIGVEIARLIKFLMKQTGISAQKFHLIGHSLGAHTAGYAGERVPNLGRITGLDPAGPAFQGTDPVVRLDPTDANFVDIIHTNGAKIIFSGLGMTEPCGHMDFYPNGGSVQPGCSNGTGDEARPTEITAIFGKHKCDHMRATKYFQESVNPSNTFQSVLCGSYEDFQRGRCANSAVASPMGLYAQKKSGLRYPAKFFLSTSAGRPYSLR